MWESKEGRGRERKRVERIIINRRWEAGGEIIRH